MDIKKFLYLGFLILITLCSFDFSTKQKINIVFIGDSITEGEQESKAPPAYATAFLQKQMRFDNVKFSNQGVSGCTTVDFLPSTATHFADVEKAADNLYGDKQATLIFSIMLGTNDSAIDGPLGSPVSSDSYSNNMSIIINSLLQRYSKSKIIIHYPLWYSPNTYNSSKYLLEGLTRLQTYFPIIEALVKSYSKTNFGHVFEGDKYGFSYFKKNHLTHMLHETESREYFTCILMKKAQGTRKLLE